MIKKISAILLTSILTSCAAQPVYAQRLYDSPKCTSKRYQDQSVSEFGSRVFVQCLKDEKILRK